MKFSLRNLRGLFLIRNLTFTSALYKKLFMKEKIINRLFILLSPLVLFSCAVINSKIRMKVLIRHLCSPPKILKSQISKKVLEVVQTFSITAIQKSRVKVKDLFFL